MIEDGFTKVILASSYPKEDSIMSWQHLNAAFACRKFRGNTRLLLIALANRASDGKGSNGMAYGWCKPGIGQLMMDTGIRCRDTVVDNLRILVEDGAIRRARRMGTSSLTYVNIDALRSWAYKEEDKQTIRSKAASGNIENGARGGSEVLLDSDVEDNPTNDVMDCPTPMGGNLRTNAAGKVPSRINSKESKEKIDLIKSPSDSGGADSEVEAVVEEDEWCYGNCSKDSSSIPNERSHPLSSKSDYQSVRSGDFLAPCSPPPAGPSPGAGAPLPEEEPAPEEYEDVVYLCSLWRSTHPEFYEGADHDNNVDDVDSDEQEDADDGSSVHPWGPPRTWTAAQRREACAHAKSGEIEEWSDDPDEECESGPSTEASDDDTSWLFDEEQMLDLYLQHGKGRLENILRWLPCSEYWYGNENSRLVSLRQLRNAKVWQLVSNDYDKYRAKAAETGTEARCESWIQRRFDTAGGCYAASICFDRLEPIDPRDAEEEEQMYRDEEEYISLTQG